MAPTDFQADHNAYATAETPSAYVIYVDYPRTASDTSNSGMTYYCDRNDNPTLPPPWSLKASPKKLDFLYRDRLHQQPLPVARRLFIHQPCWRAGRWKSLT